MLLHNTSFALDYWEVIFQMELQICPLCVLCVPKGCVAPDSKRAETTMKKVQSLTNREANNGQSKYKKLFNATSWRRPSKRRIQSFCRSAAALNAACVVAGAGPGASGLSHTLSLKLHGKRLGPVRMQHCGRHRERAAGLPPT